MLQPEKILNHMMNIAAEVMSETKRINKLSYSGQEVSSERVKSLPLGDFQEAFLEYSENFLSDELLDRVLEGLRKNVDSMKEMFPEGTKILIAAFPCNINGDLFSETDIKNGEYLTALFVNEKTGLSTGFGALSPSTHAKLLPQEIQDRCSFKVHYNSDKPYADEKDFENFAEQYRKAYHELRKLLMPES